MTDQKFIVYKSSAGSGKTYTLVREYLKIVLSNPDHFRRVLAITFTNKAANEMKERVVRYLVALSGPETHQSSDAVKYLLPQLSEQLRMDRDLIAQRASMVLRLIIHHYGDFAISTIDSFTHRVIRTFAHDLKIPLNFEVELDTEAMLAEAVDFLISMAGTDEQLTGLLVDFTEKKAGDEQSWHVEHDLNRFGKALLSEDSIAFTGMLGGLEVGAFLEVRKKLFLQRGIFEKEVKEQAARLVELLSTSGIGDEDLHGKTRGALTYLRALSAGKFQKIQPSSYARKSLESGQWLGTKPGFDAQRSFERVSDRLVPAGMKLLNFIDEQLEEYQLVLLLIRQLFSTALLGELEKVLSALCNEDNKLLISDFNRRISGIVRQQPAPFIYERLGEKYQHYLVDEFQDTSVLQWHNLLPLIENSLASARMNLVVGDAKQAIYRWRSGDAEQFENLPSVFTPQPDPILKEREETLKRHYREERLDDNHRSSPVIVDFNNRLFDTIRPMLPGNFGSAYDQVMQTAVKKDKPGLVRIEPVDDQGDRQQYTDKSILRVQEIIGELLEDRFRLRDIAVLCRDNRRAAKIASFLISQGIPVISSESLLLSRSEHAGLLIAFARHLANPGEDIPMAGILRYMIARGMTGEESMQRVFLRPVEITDAAPSGQERLARFRDVLSAAIPGLDPEKLKSQELYGMMRALVFHFGMDPGESYTRFFLDAVLRFIRSRNGSLDDFLNWWEEEQEKASVIIPEGIDAVRIMTIHKAKGLQFPAVIFPFADEEVRATRKNIWVEVDADFYHPVKVAYLPAQKSLESTAYRDLFTGEMERSQVDMVNVLYVALTRPEERLYVLTRKLPDKADKLTSAPKIFSYFFSRQGVPVNEQGVYQFGKRWKREVTDIPEKKLQGPKEGREAGRTSLNLLLRRHAPGAWDMKDPGRNREWGNLVHLALSQIGLADEAESVLEEFARQGLVREPLKEKLRSVVLGLLHHPGIRAFFEPGCEVRNEPEIITGKGEKYRPDRVVFKDGLPVVIDYKTGRPDPEHRGQVENYLRLLQEMGCQAGSGYLVYLNREPEVVRVC